jgi:cellobiose-specific phosphotransferase system component IIB
MLEKIAMMMKTVSRRLIVVDRVVVCSQKQYKITASSQEAEELNVQVHCVSFAAYIKKRDASNRSCQIPS